MCFDDYEKLISLNRDAFETLRYDLRFYELKSYEYNAQQHELQTACCCARGGILEISVSSNPSEP